MSLRERAYGLSVAAAGTLLTVFIIYAALSSAVDLSGLLARLIVGR